MEGREGLVVVIVITMAVASSCRADELYPVVVVPGSSGSQLEARMTTDTVTSWWCSLLYPVKNEEGGWFRLWFDISILLSPFTKCFAERMMIYYDPLLDDYRNAPGVETRVSHFGSTQSFLYLNPYFKESTSYMETFVESLQGLGYTDNQTLFGAPYDFRYGLASEGHPSQIGSAFLQNLKQLIEEASDSNGGKPVIIVSHSLGCLFVLQLLNRNPPSWRQHYVKHFIALSAPWGGMVDKMLTFTSGNSLDVPLVNPFLLRNEQRSSESNLWLMPRRKHFPRETPLVVTPNATYSSYDISSFLEDIGFPEGVHPYETRILPLVEKLVAPGVPVTCIVGSGVETPETLYFGYDGFDKKPEIVYGDGDGMVNMVSLLALEEEWKNEEKQTLKVIKVDGISHTNIVKDDKSIAQIMEEITAINSALLSRFSGPKDQGRIQEFMSSVSRS